MFRATLRAAAAGLLLTLSTLAVAGAPELFDSTIEQTRALGALALEGELFHVQGLALSGDRIWATSVDQSGHRGYLHEFDRATGKRLRRIDLTDGARYHVGGISLYGGSIWVPVAEMRPHSSAVLVEVDAAHMAVRRRIAVADHLGCVAAQGQRLIAGNWDSRELYLIDLSRGMAMRRIANPSQTHFQDMKIVGDQLVASGNTGLWSGTIEWIDLASMRVTRSLRAGAVGALKPIGRGGPLTGEGMAIEGSQIYLLAEDGPGRVLHFALDPVVNPKAGAAPRLALADSR